MTSKSIKKVRKYEKKPTPKQKKYLELRIQHPEKTQFQAAIEAGYTESTAARACVNIERSQGVGEILTEIQEDAVKELGITAAYILSNIKNVIEEAKKPFPVTDKEGNIIAERIDSRSILKGCELLGKYKEIGLWTEKVEHSSDPEKPFSLNIILSKEEKS